MIVVTKGRYRGSIGRVRDANDTSVQVELQTFNRKIQVGRSEVQEVDETGKPKDMYNRRDDDKALEYDILAWISSKLANFCPVAS